MLRRAARAGLVALLAVSVLLTGWSALRIWRDPVLRPLIDRSTAEFMAALDREMAAEATPAAISARLTALLAEDPRNWIAIQAVEEVAASRALALTPQDQAARDAAWQADSGLLTVAGACLSCMVDASSCSLSEALICNAPMALTPVGDVIGLGRAGFASVTGGEVDRLDLALSAIGLGATVAVVATGGTSYTLKAGASLLRLARKMSLLPPRLLSLVTDAARHGIRWDKALQWDRITDPARLIVPDVVAPVAAVAADLGRINGALDTQSTLHLLRFMDGPDDARRIADATTALGPRAVGTLEILGKSRFMRAALRFSDEAAALIAGIVGLMLSLGMALASLVQSLMLRALRRGLRAAAR